MFSVECSLISTEAGAMNLLPTNCTKFPESNEEEDDDFDNKQNHRLEVLQHYSSEEEVGWCLVGRGFLVT